MKEFEFFRLRAQVDTHNTSLQAVTLGVMQVSVNEQLTRRRVEAIEAWVKLPWYRRLFTGLPLALPSMDTEDIHAEENASPGESPRLPDVGAGSVAVGR